MIGLSGLGVSLGRVLRWNSWDLLLTPRDVLADVAAILRHPLGQRAPLAMSAVFAALLFVCYITFTRAGAWPAAAPPPQRHT